MKVSKIENTKRNIVFGVLLKIYQLVLPFIFRTIMAYTLGIQYLGLNGLFTSILQILNLAELGIGSAMVFSMYRPIVEEDDERICALMRLYKIYYHIIGMIILVGGLILTPFIPCLISREMPDKINIYILYIINLGATVSTYWMFAYRNSILNAYQRQDIISKVTIITDTLKYSMQLAALYIFRNYYYYAISILLSQVLNNLITAIISQKMYPKYKPKGKLPKREIHSINQRIRDLFTARFGGVIVNSADTIVISSFLGLEVLAVYQNYFLILNAVMAFMAILNNSVRASIGNSMITKSLKDNFKIFNMFIFIEIWILGFCICCFSSLFQSFMILWMGEELLLNYSVVFMLCIYFLGYEYVMMMSVYKDASGIWHEDRYRPLISGLVNLALNLMFVKAAGIYGIVLSTIISIFLISGPWITRNVFSLIFRDESLRKFVKQMIVYLIVMGIAAVFVNLICAMIPNSGIITFIIKLCISVFLSNMFFVVVYFRYPLFKDSICVVKQMFSNDLWRNHRNA